MWIVFQLRKRKRKRKRKKKRKKSDAMGVRASAVSTYEYV